MSSAEVATPTEPGESPKKWPQTHVPQETTTTLATKQRQRGTPTSAKKWTGSSKLRSGDSESSPLVTTQMSPSSLPRSPVATEFEDIHFTIGATETDIEPWQPLVSTETQV